MKYYDEKKYENYSCHKLSHKIFLEDIKNIDPNNINSNQDLKLFDNDIFDEIIKMPYRVEYKDKINFQKMQNKLYEKYLSIKRLNTKLSGMMSDSESGTENEMDKNHPLKINKIVEFDLILKDVNGRSINNYLENMKDDN